MSAIPTLDDLVDGSQGAGRERIESALAVAQREWNNISKSLGMCGDTGGFDKSKFMIGLIDEDVIIKHPLMCATKSVDINSPTYYPMYFVKNLLEMDSLMRTRKYSTPQALYCYLELAVKAAEALGLCGTIAMGFGCGYAVARTGWIAEKGLRREREFFLKTFFEDSGKNHEWGFKWHSTQVKIKKIFDKFTRWQKDAVLYKTETAEERKIKPSLV